MDRVWNLFLVFLQADFRDTRRKKLRESIHRGWLSFQLPAKGGGTWSVRTARKGGTRDRGREKWLGRECFCVGERGGVLRERERVQSDPSCAEDTQEKCIPQAASTRKAAKQTGALTTSFKSLHDNDWLLLTSPAPAGSLRTPSA